jgi:CcmD family protein
MSTLKRFFILLVLAFCSGSIFAQGMQPATQAPVEMATGLYQSGKIYVVVAVVAIIFIGIVTYLILLDRKISKLEKEVHNK